RLFSALRFGLLALSLALAPLSPAQAGSDEQFVAARDAFRAGDLNRLERLAADLKDHELWPYVEYFRLRAQLDKADASTVAGLNEFLARQDKNYIAEKLRGDWLRILAKQQRWSEFDGEFPKIIQADQDLSCLALQSRLQRKDPKALDEALPLFKTLLDVPEPCGPVLDALVAAQRVNSDDVWARIRRLFEANKLGQAWNTAQYLPVAQTPDRKQWDQVTDKPLPYLLKSASLNQRLPRELALLALQRIAKNDPGMAAQRLEGIESQLPLADRAWAWGQVGWQGALRHYPEAVGWYRRSGDQTTHSDEVQAWKVRAALRAQDWDLVRHAVEAMTPTQAADPSWTYWLGRAYKANGRADLANPLFERIAGQPNFYGNLAEEEMGRSIKVPPTARPPSREELARVGDNLAIRRALALFRANLRFEGTKEWSWALRGMDDRELLAAAAIARSNNIYDRAIAAADRTKNEHDYSVRYLSPYDDQVRPAARQQQLDDAWVYGLMRQESRFVTNAKSSVGASGLMQLMPATARWVAKKIGLKDYDHGQVTNTDTNVLLGTSYMRMVMESLDNHPVLASAAYNAGPGRAQKWRAAKPIEGAIYAETIPFSETRDYVKKVMSNSVYYASLFNNGRPQSLKNRLGVVTPKGSGGENQPKPEDLP
ncbi:MAG TPA: transglycosylase SLT domain-containing protein, partial [Azospira sp.]|nr:transglycosylase SLT domain-containing protein [Azospira sp.]